jgi:cytochrome c oxidase subunit II
MKGSIRGGVFAALGLAPLLGAAEPSMSYLRTFGPAGDPETQLGWGLGIVSIIVMVVITVLVLASIAKRRAPVSSPRELTVDRDEGGLSWIYIGVGISGVVLIACAIWTMLTVSAVAMPRGAADLSLRVNAAQWWWDVRYQNSDPSQVFDVANEIHIPVGRPVRVELVSSDVIHSFWFPQLAGKMDVIPGQTNVTWLQADHPGVYRGQCGEFCGEQHAHMAMYVYADSPRDYLAWTQRQRSAAAPAPAALQSGAASFVARCGACHTVRGTGAGGILGPDLTHLMSRRTIAAGLLPNTPGNLSAWIADAPALKPGTRMPALALSGPELSGVVAYLNTLQ